mmetsp:Transcript_34604/g.74661  ORF Transcript_34604/g.74661 Transcript_34604/m.74661 type:complete len:299 (-) Transcript_34604:892-1788(-)
MAHRLHLLIDAVQYHPSVIKQGSVPGHPSRRVEPSTYTATSPRARRPQGAPRRRSWAPLGGTTAGSSNDSSGLSSLRSRVLPTESDVPTHGDRTLVALVPPQRWVSRPVGHGSEARPNVPRRQAGSIVSHPKLAPLLPAALHPRGESQRTAALGFWGAAPTPTRHPRRAQNRWGLLGRRSPWGRRSYSPRWCRESAGWPGHSARNHLSLRDLEVVVVPKVPTLSELFSPLPGHKSRTAPVLPPQWSAGSAGTRSRSAAAPQASRRVLGSCHEDTWRPALQLQALKHPAPHRPSTCQSN